MATEVEDFGGSVSYDSSIEDTKPQVVRLGPADSVKSQSHDGILSPRSAWDKGDLVLAGACFVLSWSGLVWVEPGSSLESCLGQLGDY